MLEKDKVKRHIRRFAMLTGLLIVVTGLIVSVSFLVPPFAGVYSFLSRVISGFLGWVFSFVPFSVAEWLLIAAASASVIYLIRAAVHCIWVKKGWGLLRWLTDIALTAACLTCIGLSVWGCNYFLPKVDVKMGLTVEEQPPEVLHDTARWLLKEVQNTYDDVPRYKKPKSEKDADEKPKGVMDAGGFFGLREESVVSVRKLQAAYPEIFGGAIITAPKYVTASNSLSYAHISGIYFPLTGECNINTVTTDSSMPHTMNHEMAHRLGCAPEQDANFVAFLSCMESDDPSFRYSGALIAFYYCVDAIEDSDVRRELWDGVPKPVLADNAYSNEVWGRYATYESPVVGEIPVSEISEAFNDGYLTIMQQPDGVKSYGRVVDLLIAYYLAEVRE